MSNMQEKQERVNVGFFNIPENWRGSWQGMPAFLQDDLTSFQSVIVHFKTPEDRDDFGKLVKWNITDKTKSLWYPALPFAQMRRRKFIATKIMNPRFPVYVISKGRWESRLTVRALEAMEVPYHVVIEPQEYKQYAAVIDPEKILKLPFSNLGKGSIPARNWVWEHSMEQGAKRHWILDDNIRVFYRMYNNENRVVLCGNIFRAIEDYTERYENVPLSGMNYFMFVPRKTVFPPYYLNTRIYSCILIDNSIKHRWRGRYNEDTDLSLRVLKDGQCTLLFNAFVAKKMPTMSMKGGNTDQLYQDDGRLQMAQSLKDQHPDVTKIKYKWGRWQHSVDYRPFRSNKLILKKGLPLRDKPDEYGMRLIDIPERNATEKE